MILQFHGKLTMIERYTVIWSLFRECDINKSHAFNTFQVFNLKEYWLHIQHDEKKSIFHFPFLLARPTLTLTLLTILSISCIWVCNWSACWRKKSSSLLSVSVGCRFSALFRSVIFPSHCCRKSAKVSSCDWMCSSRASASDNSALRCLYLWRNAVRINLIHILTIQLQPKILPYYKRYLLN